MVILPSCQVHLAFGKPNSDAFDDGVIQHAELGTDVTSFSATIEFLPWGGEKQCLESISAMQSYRGRSVEELREVDYKVCTPSARRPCCKRFLWLLREVKLI